MKDTFLLPRLLDRRAQIDRLLNAVMCLPLDRAWSVKIAEQKKHRSLEQNAYLWGVVYAEILKQGGEALGGWREDDLHEYLLGEWAGWETLEAFGRKRMRPIRRSSGLSTREFMDFTAFIQQRMAEHGIVVPDPEPEYAA